MKSSSLLDHKLHPHFESLSQINHQKELDQSPIYQKIQPQVKTLLASYEHDSFAPKNLPAKDHYRAVTWNIERGMEYEGILHTLKNHPQLSQADILLIPETDLGMIRSANRNIARELAQALQMNYYFVPTYLNLSKGNGAERHFKGDNTLGLHGNAILSRYPLQDFHQVPLKNAKDKMKGSEKRLGNQQALICTSLLPQGPLRLICAHLDAHSSKTHRRHQVLDVLQYLQQLETIPSLFGGDFNTTTYNSSKAAWAIFGFWLRVFMGVRYVIAKHYPYPDRFFEKALFKSREKAGFDYKNWNEPGVCTLHYSVEDIQKIKNLKDLIPNWCFKFIDWALAKNQGRCSFKIDWFAAKGLKLANNSTPKVLGNLQYQGRPCSDHDAIMVDFRLS